jgi:hypothetical protein
LSSEDGVPFFHIRKAGSCPCHRFLSHRFLQTDRQTDSASTPNRLPHQLTTPAYQDTLPRYTMAFSNSTPYFRQGNVRSISSYVEQSYAENAPPCCFTYAAGGGHDWTCRISGHAFYINYGRSNGSSPRPSTDESVRSASTQPLLPAGLPAPPAYSAIPRENDLPFHEFPPTYDSIIRADRFYFVRHLPGCTRFVHPLARTLNEAELAATGVHVGHPPARRSIRQACAAKLKADLTWVLPLFIVLAVLVGFLLKRYA